MSDNNDMDMAELTADFGSDMHNDPFDDVVETGDFDESGEIKASDDDSSDSDSSEESSEEPIVDDEHDDSENEDEEEDSKADPEDKEEVEETKEEKEESKEEGEEKEDAPEETLESISKQLESGEYKVKIDDETEATLKDLKNDYIGQKEISKRFTEIDVRTKQIDRDMAEINGYIDQFASKLKDGDSVGAMQFFGEFAQIPPYMVKEQLIAALAPEIKRREQMSATEVQNEYLHNQNSYLTEQQESEQQQKVNEQTAMDLENSIKEIRETHSIEESEWDSAVKHLDEALDEGKDITPELVTEYVQYGRRYDLADSIIESSREELGEKAAEWVEELVNAQEAYPELNREDLEKVLEDAISTTKKSSAEQKLTSKLEGKKAPVAKKTNKQLQSEQEDIDPELEDWI